MAQNAALALTVVRAEGRIQALLLVEPAPWPWRHVIHIEDTVPLSENRLRYYDHQVVKVLATWRELSWYELYALGDTIDQK